MKLKVFLKKKRLEMNLSQTGMATFLGMNYVTYNHLENGKSKCSYVIVDKISKKLNVSISEIREMKNNENNE